MILEAIRSTWELPLSQGLLVAAAVLAAGTVAWVVVVGALRRFGPAAPWWAVDLSGLCAGLAAGFVVVVAWVVPGPAVTGELVQREGELRLATVHEVGPARRVRVRVLPGGGHRAGWRLGEETLTELDPWTGGPRTGALPTRCPLTPVSEDGVSSLRCGALTEHGLDALSVQQGELVADGAGWSRPLGSLLDGTPLVGVALYEGALVIVGSTRRRVVAAALDPASGRVRWRTP